MTPKRWKRLAIAMTISTGVLFVIAVYDALTYLQYQEFFLHQNDCLKRYDSLVKNKTGLDSLELETEVAEIKEQCSDVLVFYD
jgi:hypothetical protein